MITEEQIKILSWKIQNEGFDYAMDGYSSWPHIEDDHFHELRNKMIEAKNELSDYLESLGVEFEEY